MCTAFFALGLHPHYPLIIASNRDEFYARPANAVCLWGDPPTISGLDCKANGTWFAVSPQGRFSLVTNYRGGKTSADQVRSRGELPLLFVQGNDDQEKFLDHLRKIKHLYSPFSLVFGDRASIRYFSSPIGESGNIAEGLLGLSNAAPDVPWPKVVRGKAAMQHALALEDENELSTALFALLSSKDRASPNELPTTGIPQEQEEFLSSIFIASATYGTRASSVVLFGCDGAISFIEQGFGSGGKPLGETRIDCPVR